MENDTFWSWNFRPNKIFVYLYVFLFVFVDGIKSQAETTTTTMSATTVQGGMKASAIETISTIEKVRSGKCRQGSFYHADGLTRYFECCETEMSIFDCYQECPCFNGGYCDHSTKTCRCPVGRTGDYCGRDCDTGHYGIECVEMCTCGGDAMCESVNGLCSCPEGNNCIRCMVGLYGPTCIIPCMCGVGIHCDENGNCLQEGVPDDGSSKDVAVALGVILGFLILMIFLILVYLLWKNRRDKRKSDYIGLTSSGDIPFDIGTGRDSVDLVESPLQAPRNLTGLMKYLNDRGQAQEGYVRQTSSMGNRELPNIPEADTSESIFLASDGTRQPVVEPISPTLTSGPSFDIPDSDIHQSCDWAVEAPPQDAPLQSGTTNKITPAPTTINNQITAPYIVINYSHEAGSNHETPVSSPSGSSLSIHSSHAGDHHLSSSNTLPVRRPFRSMSSPGSVFYKTNNADYDQLDRTLRKTSFTSGASSACESGSENSYDKLRTKQHRKMKKSSLKRKRHSLDKLAVKSRTEETDTESDQTPPMPSKPLRNFARIPLGKNLGSSSGSSPGSSDQQSMAHKGSPIKPPLSFPATDDAEKAHPYMVTSLKDCKPSNDGNNGGMNRKFEDVGYAKPVEKHKRDEAKKPLNHDYFVLSIKNDSSETSEDDSNDKEVASKEETLRNRTDDYEKPMVELQKPSQVSKDESASSEEEGTLDQRIPILQDHKEHSTKNGHARPRVDDYETPIEYLKREKEPDEYEQQMVELPKPPAVSKNDSASNSEGETMDQRTPMLQDKGYLTKNEEARPRVDDYETPMEFLRKETERRPDLAGIGDDEVESKARREVDMNKDQFKTTASSQHEQLDDCATPMNELMKPPHTE
ncbi:uncharacterized protein [Amphiura filiformis]|uniref:uncharacterized protein n=1 Tax=Amphiura filiformis TaxID=82378 RepID=UPI003B21AEDC